MAHPESHDQPRSSNDPVDHRQHRHAPLRSPQPSLTGAAQEPSRQEVPGRYAIGQDASAKSREWPQLDSCKLLLVDDEPINLRVLQRQLETCGYRHFVSTSDAREVLTLVRQSQPDLVLLDIVMPHMSGLEVLAKLREERALEFLPVLILTASADNAAKTRALDLGVMDFLSKPVDTSELASRVRNALLIKAHQDRLARHAEELEHVVQQRTQELLDAQRELVHCLARAGEYRDHETGNHTMRVGLYAGAIARQLGLAPDHVEILEQAALLHDVGKIGISDLILLKPGRLTVEEFSLMKKHCEYGRDIIQPRDYDLGGRPRRPRSSPLMEMAARIAMTHHEWWNGQGYPRGLVGEEIPIEGRITALADVFDALSSTRPYKPAYPPQRCLETMAQNRGTQFDPHAFDAFESAWDEILEIRRRFGDDDSPESGELDRVLSTSGVLVGATSNG
jgi:putative two-component system response regulator